MPPVKKGKLQTSRYFPYKKSKSLVSNLSTYLRRKDFKKRFSDFFYEKYGTKYTQILPNTLSNRTNVIAKNLQEFLYFIDFHLRKGSISEKLNYLEVVNDELNLYLDEYQDYIDDKDDGRSLLLAMSIPYYNYAASVVNFLADEFESNELYILEQEIYNEIQRKETLLYSKNAEVDNLADLLGKL